MEATNLLGLAAGALTTLAFLPQVIKTWKTRSTHDISAAMFAIFSTGLVLWLIYGIHIDSWPIIVANIVTLVLSLTLLYFKIRYR